MGLLLCLSNVYLYPKTGILPSIPLPKSLLYCRPCCLRCSVLNTQISQPAIANDERRSANYQPTIWSYDFLQSLKDDQADVIYKDRAEKLEQELRHVINDEDAEPMALLVMIDDIQRLGLGHRFEKDIRRTLDKFVSLEESNNVTEEKSLHVAALRFRLLRQHGYEVSQDVFKAFNDNEGNFLEWLSKDVEGMLSLHEASYLAFEGEDLTDKALAFTRMHLKNMNNTNRDILLSEEVSQVLELPLHRRTLRQEARRYIEAYSKKKDANPMLLELAKLDFNMAMSTLQRDLKEMSRWWKDIGLASKLNFARDRLMECFFWTVGMVPQPQFRKCRKGLTKVTALITTIDDVYDIYGSLDELELFTDAVQRWDVKLAMGNLPDYMELCFLALYNTVNEIAYDTLKDHGKNALPYLAKAWADLCRAFLVESKWCHNKHTPSFKDYLENAWVSVSGLLILVHAYFSMGEEVITAEALRCLEEHHDLLRWPSLIFRLCNDLGTSKAELERGESASSILCYMKETGCSEEVAREHIGNLIDKSWKKINKSRVGGSPFGDHFVETAINLARISHTTYQHGDEHGHPDDKSKNRVASLILDPVSLGDK